MILSLPINLYLKSEIKFVIKQIQKFLMKNKIRNSKKIKPDKKSIYLRKLILMCLKHEKRGHVAQQCLWLKF